MRSIMQAARNNYFRSSGNCTDRRQTTVTSAHLSENTFRPKSWHSGRTRSNPIDLHFTCGPRMSVLATGLENIGCFCFFWKDEHIGCCYGLMWFFKIILNIHILMLRIFWIRGGINVLGIKKGGINLLPPSQNNSNSRITLSQIMLSLTNFTEKGITCITPNK